ncbi:helix-turn-helix domain-containing protein [Anaeromyxobacter sp. SG66]|uniref:helix-turn-helix domain-containing protein n=1 Tax=Anaeromyxobacter sp. SG66 TaxID=2925410 RepID=UPI001F58E914|nr:helix-turn-helix domain-containing protein [Anaeromyxobacter sp. SG66]
MTGARQENPAIFGETETGAASPTSAGKTSRPPEGWLCRSCACVLRVPYTYPPSPWAYCARGGCAMTPDEQLVALARLQLGGEVAAGTGNTTGNTIGATGTEIMSIPEAAQLLRRSVKGVYRLAAAGALPGASKVGGRWIVSRATLLRSVREGSVPPRRSRR